MCGLVADDEHLDIPGVERAALLAVRESTMLGPARRVFAAVWRGREVVVRVVEGEVAPGLLAQLRAIADALRRQPHPYVCTLHEVGLMPYDVYLIEDRTGARSLADVLHSDGPQPLGPALETAVAVASAVDALHACGTVMGRVHPRSVRLAARGCPVLTGIGSTWVAEGPPQPSTRLMALAPEQIDGAPASVAGEVYALGAMLATQLRGAAPFSRPDEGSMTEFIRQIMEGPRPDLRADGVPAVVADLVMGMMARDPAMRPATVAAVVAELQAVQRTLGLVPTPKPPWTPPADTRHLALGLGGG